MYFTGFGNGRGKKKENMRMFETERGSQFTFICCLQSSLMLVLPGEGRLNTNVERGGGVEVKMVKGGFDK